MFVLKQEGMSTGKLQKDIHGEKNNGQKSREFSSWNQCPASDISRINSKLLRKWKTEKLIFVLESYNQNQKLRENWTYNVDERKWYFNCS